MGFVLRARILRLEVYSEGLARILLMDPMDRSTISLSIETLDNDAVNTGEDLDMSTGSGDFRRLGEC